MGRHSAPETEIPSDLPMDTLASIISRAGREGVRVGWNAAMDAVAKGIEDIRSEMINRSCEGSLDALALAIADMRMQSERMESAT